MGLEDQLSGGHMTTGQSALRARYGAGPLHLLALLAGFAIAAAGVIGWFQRPSDVESVLVWFAAAIVIHDVLLLPLYTLLDRIALALHGRLARPRVRGNRLNAASYVRIPAILSGLLLIVFFPVISGLGARRELAASGIPERGYLTRWLLAVGVMFALSGGAYVIAAARARTRAVS
jgi:hypothetical protein